MTLEMETLQLLAQSLKQLDRGFCQLPNLAHHTDIGRLQDVLNELATRMQDNYPYHHPLYAGQMLKPPHPVARLAYCLSLWINPNNHALDGGRATSAMEKEAVARIAQMLHWDTHLGHLCSGGTMANLEAIWVSAKLAPGKKMLASEQAHYTHGRISEVLGLDFQAVAVDPCARMDLQALESALQRGNVGTVVATLGTTGTGSVDPLPEILQLKDRYGFRLHVDAAYGGYYCLVDELPADVQAAFAGLGQVDSIVIDPHKHGLQPYGCGCVLFRDPSVGSIYKHDSPYTYFSSDELHLGEISLECSRPGASAAALWATQKLLPLEKGGEFAKGLASCRRAALEFYERLKRDPRFLTLLPPDLDIVIWAPKASASAEISRLSKALFDDAAKRDLHFALVQMPVDLLRPYWSGVSFDEPTVTCLRSCLMKPEHLNWMDRIWSILDTIC